MVQRPAPDVPARPHDMGADARVGISQRAVASYPAYPGAVRAVDQLRDEDFPVDRAAVVGHGIHPFEQGTGQLPMGSVAARGAVSGAIVGIALGWLLDLFGVMSPMIAVGWVIVNAAVLGAVVATVVALIAYTATRGRRRISGIPAVMVERYDLLVDAELADRAAALLRQVASAPRPPRHTG